MILEVVFALGLFAIVVGSIALLCAATLFMMTYAVIYAKIAFALFFAWVINNTYPILENGGFLSYLIWAVIFVGGILLLSLIPRLNCAFTFGCTAFISNICVYIVAAVITGIISLFSDNAFEIPFVVEVILRVICAVITLGILWGGSCGIGVNRFHNPIIINIERLAASFVYGIGTFAMLMNMLTENSNELLILFGAMAVTFVLDIFLTGKQR